MSCWCRSLSTMKSPIKHISSGSLTLRVFLLFVGVMFYFSCSNLSYFRPFSSWFSSCSVRSVGSCYEQSFRSVNLLSVSSPNLSVHSSSVDLLFAGGISTTELLPWRSTEGLRSRNADTEAVGICSSRDCFAVPLV